MNTALIKRMIDAYGTLSRDAVVFDELRHGRDNVPTEHWARSVTANGEGLRNLAADVRAELGQQNQEGWLLAVNVDVAAGSGPWLENLARSREHLGAVARQTNSFSAAVSAMRAAMHALLDEPAGVRPDEVPR